jgi:hypothetical protein
MQQVPVAQWQHQDSQDLVSPSLVQRIAQWSKLALAQTPSNAAKFDDFDLDERVRLSGEW